MKLKLIVTLIGLNGLNAQPEARFDPFDWVLLRDATSINSISEGLNYTYFGSVTGGVLRFNNFGREFEEPITTAQGLSSNSVTAVHFDRQTGILWATDRSTLNYSYTNTGDWFIVETIDLGLNAGDQIIQIGSSQDYIWCRTQTLYLKCDHASGILVASMITPDETNIVWSSTQLTPFDDITTLLADYSIFGNWDFFDTGISGPNGEFLDITTYLIGQSDDFWIGTDNRLILHSSQLVNIFYPMYNGLNNTDVQFILYDEGFWVGGRSKQSSNSGITYLAPNRQVYEHFNFQVIINMAPQSLYSAIDTGDEIWFGGEGQVLIYNKQEYFWRTLSEMNGVPRGNVISLAQDSNYVWLGASRGIGRISKKTKKPITTGLESYYDERFVNALARFGGEIWIGSDYHLRIYDISSNKFSQYKPQASKSKQASLGPLRYYTAFTQDGDNIYIGTTQGILVYNSKTGESTVAINPDIYSGKIIRKMSIYDKYMIILTNNTILVSNLDGTVTRLYNYDFMGTLNDLYISSDELWIASSKGLIKFYWQGDL